MHMSRKSQALLPSPPNTLPSAPHSNYTSTSQSQTNTNANHCELTMKFTNTILLITTTAHTVIAAPSEVTTFTFPEGSGVEGTVEVDMGAVNAQIKHYQTGAQAEAQALGLNETIALMAAGKPKQEDCDLCQSICIPLCIFPPACLGCCKF